MIRRDASAIGHIPPYKRVDIGQRDPVSETFDQRNLGPSFKEIAERERLWNAVKEACGAATVPAPEPQPDYSYNLDCICMDGWDAA